ncbi:MAG: phosphate/phosphite/phosphonate ABC transporter substrate-binding protein [Geobacteraceae bacterium]|nr:phosphate/phosphite/phosphonate ABC transporter substrate-binding protein [Geobacteraceae bacterium]
MPIKIAAVLASLFLLAFSLSGETCFSAEKPVVHFGIGLRYHPMIMYERFQPIMDYLTQHTPYKFELKISRDYEEAVKFLVEGTTDVSAIGDGGLMEAMLMHGAVPILKPLNEGGLPLYRCYIIVPANSPIRTLRDLKGKKVAFGNKHSTTGNLIPRYMLDKNGIRIAELGSLTNLGNHSAVAMAVLKGEYDAGAIKDVVTEPYLNHGLRILASSAALPSVPLIVRKGAPPEMIKAITNALTRLDRKNPEHRKIMDSWGLEFKNGFVPAKAADYRELARMFKAIPYGCGTGCH